MEFPVIVSLIPKEWVLVATTDGSITINRLQTGFKYYWTYRQYGQPVPDPLGDLCKTEEGVLLFNETDNETINISEYIDIYVMCFKDDGKINENGKLRIDDGVSVRSGGSGGSNQANFTTFGELSVAQNQVHTGWSFPYNINPTQIRSTELFGGTVTHVNNFAECETGTDPNGVAFIRTDGSLVYTPGIGAIARFTVIFDTPQENSVQLIGIGDNEDGWFFGYDGLQFGTMRRSNSVDNWTYQNNWSENVYPTLDTTKGNVYEIRFQWLGFGMQYFGIENDFGDIIPVHNISYSNKNIETSVDIPSLPISMGAGNTGNTTSIKIKSPSAVAMSQGQAFPEAFTIVTGYSYIETIAPGSNYLFTILNPATYEGKENKQYLESTLLTLANDGNKVVTFRVLFNAILTAPVYTDIATGITPAQVDTAATTFTNGLEIATFTISKGSGDSFDLTSIFESAKVWSEAALTIVAETTLSADVAVGYTFRSRV